MHSAIFYGSAHFFILNAFEMSDQKKKEFQLDHPARQPDGVTEI